MPMIARLAWWLLWIVCLLVLLIGLLMFVSPDAVGILAADGPGPMFLAIATGVWIPCALAVTALRRAPRRVYLVGATLEIGTFLLSLFWLYRFTGTSAHIVGGVLAALGAVGFYYARVHRGWCSRAASGMRRAAPGVVADLVGLAIEGLIYLVIEVVVVAITGEAIDLPVGGGSSGGGGGGGRW